MDRRSRASVWLWAAAFALWAYLTALLLHRLAEFPGLHGDEAWLGLFALRIKARGLYTPHEMNSYTGSIYAWFLSWVFGRWTPDVFTLRLPSALLNSAAAALGALEFGRRYGPRAAVAWLTLLSASALFVLKSRLGWEITALQNLLGVAILALGARYADRPAGFGGALLLLSATFLGVTNHFIFLSVPASLFLAAAWATGVRKDWARLGLLRLSAANLAMSAAVFLLKPRVTEAFWQEHMALVSAAGLLLAPAFAAAYAFSGSLDARLRRTLELASTPGRAIWARRALTVAVLLFVFFHLKAWVQVWSGVALFERFSSWVPPLAVRALLYAWAAGLLGYFALRVARALEGPEARTLGEAERFVALWALVYLGVFVLFRNINSIRYYMLPTLLMIAALVPPLSRLRWREHWKAGAASLAAAVLLNACYWREIGGPNERPPIAFRIGWHRERSADFLPKAALEKALHDEKICSFKDFSSFIDLPLVFHLQGHPVEGCDQTKVLATAYCLDCPRPPYFTWSVVAK